MIPEQVKPFLLHEESIIRRFAASYLSDGMIYDNDILPMLIKAYRMEKDKDFSGYIAMHMREFLQDLDSVLQLDRLARNVAKDRYHFEAALAYGDIELILSSTNKIYLSDTDLQHILKLRVQWHRQSTADLWDEFVGMCDTAKNDYDNFKFIRAKSLCEDLCKRQDIPMDEIHPWFEKFSWKKPDFDEVFLCLLAGNLKLAQYVEILVRCLSYDWDFINEESMYALTKIATPEVVNKIVEFYPKGNSTFKIFGSGVLEDTKIKEAEDAIIHLFMNEKDFEYRSLLIFGLCNQVSVKALDLGVPMLPDGYDKTIDSLEENLYCVSIMNGLNPPQLSDWKRACEESDAKTKHVRKKVYSYQW